MTLLPANSDDILLFTGKLTVEAHNIPPDLTSTSLFLVWQMPLGKILKGNSSEPSETETNKYLQICLDFQKWVQRAIQSHDLHSNKNLVE